MNFPRSDLEKAVIFAPTGDDLVQVLAVRVRDKNLSEVTTSDQADDTLYTLGIELVEDVIEEEEWMLRVGRREEGILSELQRNEEGLVLPLTSDLADELFAQEHLQVVLMKPHSRVAHQAITLARFAQ